MLEALLSFFLALVPPEVVPLAGGTDIQTH